MTASASCRTDWDDVDCAILKVAVSVVFSVGEAFGDCPKTFAAVLIASGSAKNVAAVCVDSDCNS